MKILPSTALIAVLVMSTVPAAETLADTVSETREKNRIVAEYYRKAMDAFYRAEYQTAISLWREVIKTDDKQSQAQKLIDMAVQKMSERIKPLVDEVRALAAAGNYQAALEKQKELLAIDQANAEWNAYARKLERIVRIIPKETRAVKTGRLVRKAVSAYLAKKEEQRIAVNASRYAWQLSPTAAGLAELKEFMESEYSAVAHAEPLVAGMNIVEQKLQSSLSNIYDGKYDRAIIDCADIIELEPDNVLAYKRAGSAYYASGNKQRAKESWATAGKYAPDDPELVKFRKLK